MIDFNKNLRNLNEEQLNNYITNLFKNEIAFGSQEIYLMQEEIKRLKRIEWEYYETLKTYREMLEDNTKQVRNEVVEKIKKHIDTQLNFYNTELDDDDDCYAVGYIGGLKWVKDVLDLTQGE